MSSLPCGITDSMLEPCDPYCGNCCHKYSDHYYFNEDDLPNPYYLDLGHYTNQCTYNNMGEIVNACDIKNCYCVKFGDFEYEPDYESDD